MNEAMTEKQREYIQKLIVKMAQKTHERYQSIVFHERSYNTWTEDRAQLTFENNPELFVVAGFWERAVPANMTKRDASKIIDLLRDGDPVYVIDRLLTSNQLKLFGNDAVEFLMSFAADSADEQ